jgi:sugar phosphate isomerase/epimerase
VATAPAYRFGISEFTTQPWSFEQDVERYARIGVEAVEVCQAKLDDRRLDEQLALLGRHGLTVSSVQPSVRTLFPSRTQPEPNEPPARMERFCQTIERLASLGRNIPFVTNTGIPPDGNIQLVLDTAAREYRAVADVARVHGVRVALEPLNAAIMNVESAIWTLEQALQVVEAVARPNFGVCLDLWNVWQNAAIDETIRRSGDDIFIVQVSDWRTPRSAQDRLIPGDGTIPLPELLRATHESGYRGPYVVEIFSGDVPDSLWRGDLEAVIARSRTGLDRAWHAAFAS